MNVTQQMAGREGGTKFRVPAQRPGALYAWGYRHAVDHAFRQLHKMNPDGYGDSYAESVILSLELWADNYCSRVEPHLANSARENSMAIREDLELAEVVPGMITWDPTAIIQMGSVAGCCAVRAVAFTATACAAGFHRYMMAISILQDQLDVANTRWMQQWAEVLRDYPWLRRYLQWPSVKLDDPRKPGACFVIDTAVQHTW